MEIHIKLLWVEVTLLCHRTPKPSPAVELQCCTSYLYSLCVPHLCTIEWPFSSLLLEIDFFGLFLFLQVRLCNICFLCSAYFIYYTILHFHLFFHKWEELFWIEYYCIVLLSTFSLSIHPSMHTAIKSLSWQLYNKHGMPRPLALWFHFI